MKARILIVLAAMALLGACKRSSEKSELEKSDYSLKKDASADSAMVKDKDVTPKLIKTAEMSFKVKSVQQVSDAIVGLTKQYNGMVMHHQMQSTAGADKDIHLSTDSIMHVSVFNTTADMVVRVPSENLEDFMLHMGHMGTYVKISKMDIEDKTLDYLSNRLKIRGREEVSGKQEDERLKTKDLSTVLSLKDDVVDKRIANLRTNDSVRYSFVSLTFYQSDTVLKEVVANNDPSSYDIPVIQRMGLAIANGWGMFMDVVIAVANLWMFVLAGIFIWIWFVFYRKRIHPAKHHISIKS